jgi:hypothetical protein
MTFHKLRILWSVFWGLACVLLIVLWVRSYSWEDMFLAQTNSQLLQFQSMRGHLRYFAVDEVTHPLPWFISQYIGDMSSDDKREWDGKFHKWGLIVLKPGIQFSSPATVFAVPIWFAAILVALLGLPTWIPWRFSLRTLLIGTTLVAVVLGLIVYGTR